jgi:hypothetical protein
MVAVLAGALALAACGNNAASDKAPVTDAALFELQVYPILLRDCAFNTTCHGSQQRFFQVMGPGRRRIDPKLDSAMPVQPAEVQFSYERARSMLITDGPVTRSLLLTKPLEARVGGAGHKGADHFGRNVYQSPLDPSYLVLVKWAQTIGATGVGATGGIGVVGGRGGIGAGGVVGTAGGAAGTRGGAGAAGRKP